MFLFHLQPVPSVPVEVVTRGANSLIDTGVLGTLLVLSVLINILVMRRMMQVQDKRVEDQKKISEVAEKMITTFASVSNHMDKMIESDRNQTGAMQALARSLDTVMVQAVTSLSRPTLPPSRTGGE